jgi:hypothetical protein
VAGRRPCRRGTWTAAEGDYERITALGTFDTVVAVGDASGLVLSSDYDDSTIEVFRVSADQLLFVGVRYADDEPYSAFLADAVEIDLEVSGTIQVRSGEVAVFAAALPWREGRPVLERPMPVPETVGVPNDEILVLRLPGGQYVLSERHVDRETYGSQSGDSTRRHSLDRDTFRGL